MCGLPDHSPIPRHSEVPPCTIVIKKLHILHLIKSVCKMSLIFLYYNPSSEISKSKILAVLQMNAKAQTSPRLFLYSEYLHTLVSATQ